jgi:hypothetical protein
MNRFGTLRLFSIIVLGLGLVLPTNYASAVQKSLKQTIIGTWSVTSVSDQYNNGKKSNAWGASIKGHLTFDHSGHFSYILIGEKEPNVESDDPRRPDAPVIAYFGSYTVNEQGWVVSIWIDRGSNSGEDGKAQKWSVTIRRDTLVLTGSPQSDSNGTFSQHLQVKRVL